MYKYHNIWVKDNIKLRYCENFLEPIVWQSYAIGYFSNYVHYRFLIEQIFCRRPVIWDLAKTQSNNISRFSILYSIYKSFNNVPIQFSKIHLVSQTVVSDTSTLISFRIKFIINRSKTAGNRFAFEMLVGIQQTCHFIFCEERNNLSGRDREREKSIIRVRMTSCKSTSLPKLINK